LKRILLIAGTHGDEPSGPYAVVSLLEDKQFLGALNTIELTVLPLVNPSGFLAGTRTNKEGKDLNRWFFDKNKRGTPAEVLAIKRELRRASFDLVISLHEDEDTRAFYLYDTGHGRSHSLVRSVLRAAGPLFTGMDDTKPGNAVGFNKVVRGYVAIDADSPLPTLEEYLSRNRKAQRVLTLEIPGKLSLARRTALAKKLVKIIIEKEK
jgi:hypothetical protein